MRPVRVRAWRRSRWGVGAGHAERLLDGPGEERAADGGWGPGEVVGGEEPKGVEGLAAERERAEDLDGGAGGLGREDGLGADAGEVLESFGGGFWSGLEVQGG